MMTNEKVECGKDSELLKETEVDFSMSVKDPGASWQTKQIALIGLFIQLISAC